MIRAILRFARVLPRQLDRLWLEAGLRSLMRHNPAHPDVPYIVIRLSDLGRP